MSPAYRRVPPDELRVKILITRSQAFTEAARVALSVKANDKNPKTDGDGSSRKCVIM